MGVNGNNVTCLVDGRKLVTGKILVRSPFNLDVAITSPYSCLHTVGIVRPEYRNTEDFTNESGVQLKISPTKAASTTARCSWRSCISNAR